MPGVGIRAASQRRQVEARAVYPKWPPIPLDASWAFSLNLALISDTASAKRGAGVRRGILHATARARRRRAAIAVRHQQRTGSHIQESEVDRERALRAWLGAQGQVLKPSWHVFVTIALVHAAGPIMAT